MLLSTYSLCVLRVDHIIFRFGEIDLHWGDRAECAVFCPRSARFVSHCSERKTDENSGMGFSHLLACGVRSLPNALVVFFFLVSAKDLSQVVF